MQKIIIIIAITIIFSVLSGCGHMSQRELMVEKNWGRSHETARFSQIINPDAGEGMVEDQSMDGVAGKYNYDQYQDDFKKQKSPSQIFNINLGNDLSGD